MAHHQFTLKLSQYHWQKPSSGKAHQGQRPDHSTAQISEPADGLGAATAAISSELLSEDKGFSQPWAAV